jgi:hypothetical protein
MFRQWEGHVPHAASPVQGSPWSHGAMGNVRFQGVPLKSMFKKFDVRPHAAAKFLTAEGAESPGRPGAADFEHSLPLDETRARAILARPSPRRPPLTHMLDQPVQAKFTTLRSRPIFGHCPFSCAP